MKKTIFLVMLTVIMSACKVTPTRQPFNQSSISNQTPIKTFIVISQEEINVIPSDQNTSTGTVIGAASLGAVGAVIGGAIDASTNNALVEFTEEQIAPIRNNLLDFEFDKDIEEKANAAFKNNQKLNLLPFTVVKNNGNIASRVPLGEAFLSISFEYILTKDFRAPTILTSVKMGLKGNGAKNDVVFYSNLFHYTGRVLNLPPEKYENQKNNPKWLQMSYAFMMANSHSEQLREDLERGVSELLEIIVDDINDPESNESNANRASNSRKYGFKRAHWSRTIENTSERVVIRTVNKPTSGAICIFSAGISRKEDQYCIY